MKKAIILLSGGLDSVTCLSEALKEGYEVYPLSFDYNQRHRKELDCAKEVVKFYNLDTHKIIRIDNFGGSALTDSKIEVPDYKKYENSIPITYVPARNIIFLSYAVGYAEVIDAECIFIGVNALDYSGYPDCRPEFIEAFSKTIEVGTKSGVENNPIRIKTPLLNLKKSEIVKLAVKNNAPLKFTSSCYNGKEKACGVCDSCKLRLKGFEEAGFDDPILYLGRTKK
ncbi:MAG: 7-cyano-7-deazaguanine synthase QueC [Clostridiales bacterium]